MVIGSSIKLTLFAACTLLALILQQRKTYATLNRRLIRDGQTCEDDRFPEN
jgi:hypothetical protein